MDDELNRLLEDALPPVDPPADLELRLESALQDVADAVSEELADWELASMRDPRNWVRPVIAVSAGTMAGAALFLLRQQRRRRQSTAGQTQVGRAARAVLDVATEARSRFSR